MSSAEVLQLPTVGAVVGEGRFELLSPLGEGGMSTVFLAQDRFLGRGVALKLLTPRYVGRPEREQRLINEAEYLRRVQGHPNIIQFIDAGRLRDHQGWPWLATEILHGEVLERLFVRGKLEVAQVVALARQVAEALRACHEAGVVHRDVTPANLFLLEDGRTLKLFDFSHAADLRAPRLSAGAPGRLTGIYDTPGTIGYMGPEQVARAPADVAMDAFGFGVLLFKLVTGRSPYRQFNDRDAFIRAQREGTLESPRLHAWAYDAPEALAELVHDCTRREGERRPDMARILERLAGIEPSPGNGAIAVPRSPAAVALVEDEPAEEQTAVELAFARPPQLREAQPVSEPEPEPEPEPSPVFARPLDQRPTTAAIDPVGALSDNDPGEDDRSEPRVGLLSRWPITAGALAVALLVMILAWSVLEKIRVEAIEPDQSPARTHDPSTKSEAPVEPVPTVVEGAETGEASLVAETGTEAEPEPQEPVEVEEAPDPRPKPKPRLKRDPKAAAESPTEAEPGLPPECDGIEAKTLAAAEQLDWRRVARLTGNKRCWSSTRQRTLLRTRAMFELGRWNECLSVGAGSSDPAVQKYVENCRKFAPQDSP